MKKEDKRGLTKIIKSLIFIFSGILIILILFMILSIILSGGFREFFLKSSKINLKIVSVSEIEEGIEINIKRYPGKGDVVGIEFILDDGIEKETLTVNEEIKENKNKIFILNYQGIVKEISIAPIIRDKNNETLVGKIADKKEFSIEEITSNKKNLVSWWKLDGNVRNEKGGEGSIEGAEFVEGKKGEACEFDGEKDYVDLNFLDLENSLSVELWYNRNSFDINNPDGIIGNLKWNFFATSREGWIIKHTKNSNSLSFILELTEGNKVKEVKVDSSPLRIERWYHIVCVFDSYNSKISLYIDGEIENSLKTPENYNKIVKSSLPLRLGYYSDNGYFKGKIDEIKIYNKALSEKEIKALYNLY